MVAYDIVELDGEHVPGAAAGAQEAGEGLMVTFLEQRRLDTCPEILKR